MIPTVLSIAFVGGFLLATRRYWVVAVTSVIWVAIVLIEGSTGSGVELLGSTALGAVNAAAGFGVGRVVRKAVGRVARL